MMRAAAILAFMFALVSASLALAQPAREVAGDWKGTLAVGAVNLRVALHINETTTFDSIDQGALGLPATTDFKAGKLTVTINGVGVYEGELSPDGQKLAGAMKQGADSLPLIFERGSFETASRPQTPRPPLPYRSVDLAYDNPQAAGVKLAATLTIPEGAGPFPAVVLISGSGTQDRDGTMLEHKSFLVLADHLTRNGIAVLRVDDRGAGKTVGGAGAANTSADFATDVAAGVAILRARPEIDGGRIGLIGHSEGGMIAPMVAREDPGIAFVVLWAGQAVPGRDVVVEQVRLGSLESGATAEQAQATAAIQGQFLDAIIAAPDSAAAQAAAAKVFTDRGLQPPAASALQQLSTGWYRYFIAYDPAPALKAVKAPMLALLGGKDTQVTPEQNLSPFLAAFAARDNASVMVLPGLNHLFQTAATGSVKEYGEITETISPVALDAMTGWIRHQTGLETANIPPPAGAIVDSFEMVPDRTVIFAPQDDGTLRILKVTDKDRLAPMPRNPGEVSIAMTYALEIGAVIEFNSGLTYAFSYSAIATGAGDAVSLPTCPVRGDSVATDQWPQGYKTIRVGRLQKVDDATVCEHPTH